MRKLRITALILVCLGLLIGGIGIGMCFVEASSFTYRDDVLLDMTQEDTATDRIPLQEDQKLLSYSVVGESVIQEDVTVQLLESAEVPEGTIQVEVDYRSVPGCGLDLYWFQYGDGVVKVNISPNLGMKALLNAKDQVLSDIKNHQARDYLFAQVTDVTFTVNPADRDQIELTPYLGPYI